MKPSALWFAIVAACAPAPVQGPQDSVVPGTIGAAVREQQPHVVVADVRTGGPAAQSGLRVGDVVVRYNGQPVTTARRFYQLVVDSPPGSTARLDILREGAPRVIHVPVEQLDILPRV